jgi:excisionase family DNA binding protein
MTASRIPSGIHELFTRDDREKEIVSDLDRILAEIPDDEAKIQLSIQPKGRSKETIPISPEHFRLLTYIVGELARGHGVSLIPMEADLTPNEAARQLKVSRPFLVGLLKKGEIPYRMVGAHHRIRFRDLVAYKQRNEQERLKALEELAALDQEYGLD